MAEHRAIAEGERGRHEPRERAVDGTGEVDAAVDGPQPAARDEPRQLRPAHPERKDLPRGEHAMLARRKVPEPAVSTHATDKRLA